MNLFVVISMTTVNIIALVAASTLTWSSSVLEKLKDANKTIFDKPIDTEESSWIASCLALGAIFGPFLFGFAADIFGRKLTILSLAVPFTVSFLMIAFGKSVGVYYVARLIMGVPVGGTFTVLPMYIGEVSTDENRGMLGSLFSVFLTMGLLFSYAVGPYASIMVYNLILAILPVIFFVGFFLICPESPHFLIKKNRMAEARSSLQKFRGSNVDVTAELKQIENFLNETGEGTFLDIFKSKALIKGFIMGEVLITLQQLSGINAVLFYAQKIFSAAGAGLDDAIASIIIGVVQLLATSTTPLVADRLGRKVLLLFSAIGMIISEVPLGIYFYLKDQDESKVDGISWLPILCMIIYIITYNVGFGAIVWAMMGEIFPANVKSPSNASIASTCWIFGFLITKFFEPLSLAIGIGQCFWIFACFCAIGVVFVQFYVIETKGKSLEEIQILLSR